MIEKLLALNERYTFVSPHVFESLWEDVSLPDKGSIVKDLANSKSGRCLRSQGSGKDPGERPGVSDELGAVALYLLWTPLGYHRTQIEKPFSGSRPLSLDCHHQWRVGKPL